MKPRRQCIKCPWKTTTDLNDIPGGYCEKKHAALNGTIAPPETLRAGAGALRIMACHETSHGQEKACVGWLVHQLGPGNNLGLRIAVMTGLVDANVRTVGSQHESFEETLPKGSTLAMPTGTPYWPKCPKCKRGKWGFSPIELGCRVIGNGTRLVQSQHSGHGNGGNGFYGYPGLVHCFDCGHEWFSTLPSAGRVRHRKAHPWKD